MIPRLVRGFLFIALALAFGDSACHRPAWRAWWRRSRWWRRRRGGGGGVPVAAVEAGCRVAAVAGCPWRRWGLLS